MALYFVSYDDLKLLGFFPYHESDLCIISGNRSSLHSHSIMEK